MSVRVCVCVSMKRGSWFLVCVAGITVLFFFLSLEDETQDAVGWMDGWMVADGVFVEVDDVDVVDVYIHIPVFIQYIHIHVCTCSLHTSPSAANVVSHKATSEVAAAAVYSYLYVIRM